MIDTKEALRSVFLVVTKGTYKNKQDRDSMSQKISKISAEGSFELIALISI